MVRLAENAGFGFDKIEENWKAYNDTIPDYKFEFDSVILIFQLEAKNELGDRLGDNQTLAEMEKDNKISISRVSKKLGISTTAIENNITKLKESDFLTRVGAPKTGFWKLTLDD